MSAQTTKSKFLSLLVSVKTMPLGTLSGPTMGLLQRTLGLPFELMEAPQILWGGDDSK